MNRNKWKNMILWRMHGFYLQITKAAAQEIFSSDLMAVTLLFRSTHYPKTKLIETACTIQQQERQHSCFGCFGAASIWSVSLGWSRESSGQLHTKLTRNKENIGTWQGIWHLVSGAFIHIRSHSLWYLVVSGSASATFL